MVRMRSFRPWLLAGVILLLAVLGGAYGQAACVLALDRWGSTFAYYDNGRPATVRVHRLPELDVVRQAPAGAGWPEAVLRPSCLYTLNLLGLSGPEGGLWSAAMEGASPESPGRVLVVRAVATGDEVARYGLAGGSEPGGLVVVELEAGPNGIYLLEVMRPDGARGWYVVRVHLVT